MTILQAVLLGFVQGITEFLPVSSSGHLSILQNIFHMNTEGSVLFNIFLHLGTLLVVFVVFRKDIWKLILAVFGMIGDCLSNLAAFIKNGKLEEPLPYRKIVGTNYRKFAILLILSTIPTGIMGILGKDLIAEASAGLLVPGICLLITGAVLIFSDTLKDGNKIPKDVSYPWALLIGVFQGLATLPGLSRSGSTITGCLLAGMNRSFAVRYSFILSIPAVLGAAVLELSDIPQQTSPETIGIYLIGAAVAAAVGFLCIRLMLSMVRKRRFKFFGFYCIAAGILALAGHFFL